MVAHPDYTKPAHAAKLLDELLRLGGRSTSDRVPRSLRHQAGIFFMDLRMAVQRLAGSSAGSAGPSAGAAGSSSGSAGPSVNPSGPPAGGAASSVEKPELIKASLMTGRCIF